jgi:membrane associated rhomboid family serine protease
MQPGSTIIQVRSERQALDWSLVLLSQGIESTIQRATEEHGWQLHLEPGDYARAVATLRSYRHENSRPTWQHVLPGTGLTFDFRAIVWFLLLALFHFGNSHLPAYREAGTMVSALVWKGEWWRLFTAVTLHADLSHLIGNCTTGLLLLGLAMAAFGPGCALLASFLAGAGANVIGLFVHPETHRGLGASGMIMAALGMLAAQSIGLLRHGLPARQLVGRGLLGGVLLLILFGFSPQSDVIAHVAGFILGLLFGAVLSLLPSSVENNPYVNRVCEAACAILVSLTWFLALRKF